MTWTEPRRGHPAVFVVVAFAWSWACWAVLVTGGGAWWHPAGGLGPLVAAVVVTAWSRDPVRWHELGASLVRWSSAGMVLAVGLPLVPAAVAVAVGDATARGPGSQEFDGIGWWLVPLVVVCYGFGEEVGWRGYLLPALLETGRTPFVATTLFVPVWAAWHLPLFAVEDSLGGLGPAMAAGWLLSLWVSSHLITWLWLRTGRSLLVVATLHATVDLVLTTYTEDAAVAVAVNATLITVAVLVVTRSRLLHEPPSQPGAALTRPARSRQT